MIEHPKVFISYSHQDSDYETKMLDFSNRLRDDGIDANIDLYEEAPSEGWPRWMENQISQSDYVLVVCSKAYYAKCYSEEEKSKGISWEVNIVYQHLYDSGSQNTKFIPVIFDPKDDQFIPTPIKPFTYYNVGTVLGFNNLCLRLHGVIRTQKPPLGKPKSLPAKKRKTMFFTSPIDLEKWDLAEWRGALYLFIPDDLPVLGLLFNNYQAGISIFKEWNENYNSSSFDEFIRIDYIVPPFPKDAWVNNDPEHNFGNGYFIHIGPNTQKSIERSIVSGFDPNAMVLGTLSRYQWMDEMNGSKNRDTFKKLTSNGSGYYVIPAGRIDSSKPVAKENLYFGFDYAIRMRGITFKTGISLKPDDICSAVLNEAN